MRVVQTSDQSNSKMSKKIELKTSEHNQADLRLSAENHTCRSDWKGDLRPSKQEIPEAALMGGKCRNSSGCWTKWTSLEAGIQICGETWGEWSCISVCSMSCTGYLPTCGPCLGQMLVDILHISIRIHGAFWIRKLHPNLWDIKRKKSDSSNSQWP